MNYISIYKSWVSSPKLSMEEREELKRIEKDAKEIEYRFGKNLEFGTAGMRGIIGMGTNMMNVYTVTRATQGLSEYVKSLGKKATKRGVVISFDTRRMSKEFAFAAALTLASNGIKAYLFPEVHPVPMLSFAVRKLKTVAGIMITASHNPKEYNGYKVYGEDGAQMSPESTAVIVDQINKIDSCVSDKILCDPEYIGRIKNVPKRVDRAYYRILKGLTLSSKEVKTVGKDIKIIYTPVHGSGYVPVTTILKKIGIKATLVPEQVAPDTEFSTVAVPNPEFKETLYLGIKMADFKHADVVFGTDPDCDRLGVAIRGEDNEFVALSGNQTGVLLLDYVLLRLKETGKLDEKGFVVKSFVTTDMAKLICKDYGVELFDVPVGFKFIGEKIKTLDDTGKRKFIFGFEESCGHLFGTHARDKDAVVASMLFAEMVCYYECRGIKIYQRLNELYKKYGYVFDTNVSTLYSGLSAMDEMNAVVDKMKTVNVDSIGNIKVVAKRNYATGKRITEGGEEDMDTPKTNAVYYELSGGGFVCIRPSGTEPKLKTYYSLLGNSERAAREKFRKAKADFEKKLSE